MLLAKRSYARGDLHKPSRCISMTKIQFSQKSSSSSPSSHLGTKLLLPFGTKQSVLQFTNENHLRCNWFQPGPKVWALPHLYWIVLVVQKSLFRLDFVSGLHLPICTEKNIGIFSLHRLSACILSGSLRTKISAGGRREKNEGDRRSGQE